MEEKQETLESVISDNTIVNPREIYISGYRVDGIKLEGRQFYRYTKDNLTFTFGTDKYSKAVIAVGIKTPTFKVIIVPIPVNINKSSPEFIMSHIQKWLIAYNNYNPK